MVGPRMPATSQPFSIFHHGGLLNYRQLLCLTHVRCIAFSIPTSYLKCDFDAQGVQLAPQVRSSEKDFPMTQWIHSEGFPHLPTLPGPFGGPEGFATGPFDPPTVLGTGNQ